MWTTITASKRLLIFVGLGGAIGCHLAAPRFSSCEGCVLLPQARRVATDKSFDGRLTYRVNASPPDGAIEQVRSKLRSDGWVLENLDPLNASVDVTARWREIIYDQERVEQWSEAWKNARGDVVWYRYTHHAQSSGELEVQATFFRKQRVQEIMRELREMNEPDNTGR